MAVAAILAVLDWAAVAAESRLLERCFKPAVLLALLAAALTAQPKHAGVHGWLVLALCFGLIGDVALSFAPPGHPPGKAGPGAVPATALSIAEAIRSDAGELVGATRPVVEAAAARPVGGAHRA
ncbi:MAG: YhhN family, partial [Pseudonocardiales bacterium]|nr:YhhN family [Pseudonocardiales bacterium]